MRAILLLGILLGACAPVLAGDLPAEPAPERLEPAAPRELVVLVHGMGRTHLSMIPLSWTLRRAGYDVFNWGYSSTCCGIAELGEQLQDELDDRAEGVERVHFVGHSLGNIIIRWVLEHDEHDVPEGRVVMLAPPNQGSDAADLLAPAFGWLLKPLPDLRPEAIDTIVSATAPEGAHVGIVSGRYDWKVSVDESHLDGERAHVIVPAFHTFLMLRPDVHRLVLEFLREGRFGG